MKTQHKMRLKSAAAHETRRLAAAADAPSSFAHYQMRAFQYVCARYRIRETEYRENPFDWPRRGVGFETDWIKADAHTVKRIRAVKIDGETYEIPHWDFVPQVDAPV